MSLCTFSSKAETIYERAERKIEKAREKERERGRGGEKRVTSDKRAIVGQKEKSEALDRRRAAAF